MMRRYVVVLTAMLLALGMMAGTATANEHGKPVDQQCEDHQIETKIEVPSGWDFSEDGPYVEVVSVIDTRTGDHIDVTVTIDGENVTFSSDDHSLEDASFCIKGGTGNSGLLSGLSGSTEDIDNRGGQTPDISYVVLYAVTTVDEDVVACDESTASGGAGVTTTIHELGQSSGTFDFSYNAYAVPDRFQVFYEGSLIHDEVIGTLANSSSYASLFDPSGIFHGTGSVDAVSGKSVSLSYAGTSTQVTVIVSGPGGTVWDYIVSCPATND